ncbi:GspE/PulE family protein [Winogradskyella forsetii]|uniref:GspE/PulE family protein n=1 Tax=Winogradskyella forsetii TaxID=2686077 RepID=UPI00277B5D2E|nr:GspE/PulE family protein [Winogradskyella forsetii]
MITSSDIQITTEIQQLINAEVAHHYGVIPSALSNNELVLFISESEPNDNHEELEMILGYSVTFVTVPENQISKALTVYYRKNDYEIQNKSVDLTNEDFLEKLIYEAKAMLSSDIHFEVYEKEARVRLRIDGLLIEKYRIPKENYLELVNKIKIKSNLDITEKRLPQDGRINYSDFDLRVSILPTLHGEKIVMRILGKDASNISLDQLGFEAEEKEIYLEGVKNTNGIVLISGPTGSGKTTTLYATLKLLNKIRSNIVTVEDPIEYTLEGINQVQLKEDIGLTFTSALRSFLRQDPDIIMLGEIRDAETAKMAIRASLTGHLVLSTIHTNSALGTISRLVDMGVPAFLIAETLNVSVAQRLLRKLCPSCKVLHDFNANELPRNYSVPFKITEHYVAKGCEECYYTGYKGRRAIYEVIPVNQDLSNRIKKDAQNLEQNRIENIEKLSDKAYKLFANGDTSLEEVYSILING